MKNSLQQIPELKTHLGAVAAVCDRRMLPERISDNDTSPLQKQIESELSDNGVERFSLHAKLGAVGYV